MRSSRLTAIADPSKTLIRAQDFYMYLFPADQISQIYDIFPSYWKEAQATWGKWRPDTAYLWPGCATTSWGPTAPRTPNKTDSSVRMGYTRRWLGHNVSPN